MSGEARITKDEAVDLFSDVSKLNKQVENQQADIEELKKFRNESSKGAFDPDQLNTVDIKTERNSRSYNFSIHVYEFATEEKINETIRLALYAVKKYNEELEDLSAEQRAKDDERKEYEATIKAQKKAEADRIKAEEKEVKKANATKKED